MISKYVWVELMIKSQFSLSPIKKCFKIAYELTNIQPNKENMERKFFNKAQAQKRAPQLNFWFYIVEPK